MLQSLCIAWLCVTQSRHAVPHQTHAVHAGCLHPDHGGFFESPAAYMRWYQAHGPLRGSDAPVAAVLVYRKVPAQSLLVGAGCAEMPVVPRFEPTANIKAANLVGEHERDPVSNQQAQPAIFSTYMCVSIYLAPHI